MARFFRSVALVASLVVLAEPLAAATVMFAVEGANSGSEPLGEGNSPGMAQSFTMTETLTDTSIGFDLFCLPNCDASLYLINGLPSPDAGVAQYETERMFSGAGNFSYELTGRTLMEGVTYTLILAIVSGNGLWRSTRDPVVTGTAATLDGTLLMTDLDIGALFLSEFSAWTDSTPRFSITGTTATTGPISPVPLPATLPLLAIGLGLLVRRRNS